MKKSNLRATSALQALALLGAGVSTAFVAATPAAAQDYTRGNIVGTVTDSAGAPVAGATVTVTSNEQGTRTVTTTDSNGRFQATSLATGTYTVVVQQGGATVVEDRGAQVLAGQNNSFAYTAGVAGTAPAADASDDGVIVVTGTRVQVDDFASTQTGATLDVAELASTVPVQANQTALILLAPGTTAGDAGFGNLASISGATIAENAYYVNGLNITDFRNFIGSSIVPFEFYRTIDVKTGGYQAEYGRALGGVTSAVTKAGSNDLKGGAVISWAPDWARENSPNTYQARNDDDFRKSVDANFYLSGPIIKDRLFFYGLFGPRYLETGDTSITGRSRLRTTSSSPFWGGKIDAVITEGHRLEFTLFSDEQTQKTRYTRYNATTETIGSIRGNVINKFGGRNYIGTYTGQFTDWLTLSAAYGKNKDQGLQTTNPDFNAITSRLTGCSATAPCTSANGTAFLASGTVAANLGDTNERTFYRADADVYVDLFGSHHFRFGADYEKLEAGEATTYAGSGYTYDVRHNLALRRYYENFGTYKTNMAAVYAQDSWSLLNDRVTLNLGVRGDKFRNYTVNGDKYYDSGYNWAPRLGATIDVFGDKKTKLNVFYGRYFLPIATNTNIRLGGAELYYEQFDFYGAGQSDVNGDGIPDNLGFNPTTGDITNFTGNQGGPCPAGSPDEGGVCYQIFSDGLLGPTDTLVAEGLKPSQTDEFILGASHRFGGGWTVGVDYVRRRLLETLEDVAVDAAVLAYCDDASINETLCTYAFTGFHQYVLANPGSDITVRLDGGGMCTDGLDAIDPTLDDPATPADESDPGRAAIPGDSRLCDVVTLDKGALGYPKAVRKYDAVQFTLDKAFNGFYGFNFNYVYTKLRGNFEGGVKSDNNQTDTGLTQDFDQPGFLDGAYGDLANGRKHAFKVYGHVEPWKGIDIGVNAVLESPRKFSCIGPYNNDNTNFAYYYGSASFYCRQPEFGGDPTTPVGSGTGSVLVPRGTAFKSQWNKRIDLGVGFDLAPLSLPGSMVRVDVFNLFNWNQVLDRNEFGDVYRAGLNPDYKKITGYQAPRSIRFTLAMRFGEK